MEIGNQSSVGDDRRRHSLSAKRLRDAIDRGELSVHYQPQYRSRDGRPCGVEALARWFPSDGDPVSPIVFITQAEQSGLISALGKWVLQDACKTAATWNRADMEPAVLCVNVSPYQIDTDFCGILQHALECSGLPASCLELEITEGILIQDPDFALKCLAQWRRLGVRIALDDFGIGYSSLSYLSRLPVDRLKIDRSLTHRVVTDSKTASIVHAVISLGEELGFAVLAEGVETEAQFEVLLRMGCQQMQGYLFSPAVSPCEVTALLSRRWGARRADVPVINTATRKYAHAS